MIRRDSALDERSCDTTQSAGGQQKARHTATPNDDPQFKQESSKSTIALQNSTTSPRRSQKKICHDHKTSSPPTGRSIGSSEKSSGRTRGQRSKPSSRPPTTSATAVDPKRPARHHRLQSTQTVPTASSSHHVDDVLALHFRSCSLFSNPSYSASPSSIHGYGHNSGGIAATQLPFSPAPAPQVQSSDHVDGPNRDPALPDSEGPSSDRDHPVHPPNTVMHWTSSETRRKEYEEIDRSNSAARCLIRRITPKCVSGPAPPRFYDEDKDDGGSVRRYRLDLPESDDEAHRDEKSTSSLRPKTAGRVRSDPGPGKQKKKWLCF